MKKEGGEGCGNSLLEDPPRTKSSPQLPSKANTKKKCLWIKDLRKITWSTRDFDKTQNLFLGKLLKRLRKASHNPVRNRPVVQQNFVLWAYESCFSFHKYTIDIKAYFSLGQLNRAFLQIDYGIAIWRYKNTLSIMYIPGRISPLVKKSSSQDIEQMTQ